MQHNTQVVSVQDVRTTYLVRNYAYGVVEQRAGEQANRFLRPAPEANAKREIPDRLHIADVAKLIAWLQAITYFQAGLNTLQPGGIGQCQAPGSLLALVVSQS